MTKVPCRLGKSIYLRHKERYQLNIEILLVGIILRNVFKYKNYIMKYFYICLHKLYDELIEKHFEQYITSNSVM